MLKTISEIIRTNVAAKAGSKGQLASSPGLTIKKPGAEALKDISAKHDVRG
ncbi:MAG: hypothetical protein U9N43_07100 [Euryarchaeota archaeon]|nr:hypothetical protein [Euryarchaeota archaeon]